MNNPLLDPEEKDAFEQTVRPGSLQEFIGQKKAINNLSIFIKAAKQR
ncbi:MAG TPA: Holliday junction branch migration DNA helicase RuvB, partial [Balneolaceae bacterium]|nr:Holliday junction branch migration DNA helicase RuvB [Balneolaceae bacterium]